METIQEIIDTIKQWPSTIWWVMGALFIISWFWDTPLRKKRNKDKVTDDKNNNLKSSNMTDKKELRGNLMKEGVILWTPRLANIKYISLTRYTCCQLRHSMLF